MEIKTSMLGIRAGVGIGIAVALLLLSAVPAVNATIVSIEPDSQTVLAGEDFSVDVYVDTVTELTVAGAVLHFEQAAVQATAITEGITSGYPHFYTFEDIDNTTGLVTFTYGLSPGSSVSGSGPLATINFTADVLAEGTYNLDLTDVELFDEVGPILLDAVHNGTVTVLRPAPVPVPQFGPIGMLALIGALVVVLAISVSATSRKRLRRK
jgi:hypothetical protein